MNRERDSHIDDDQVLQWLALAADGALDESTRERLETELARRPHLRAAAAWMERMDGLAREGAMRREEKLPPLDTAALRDEVLKRVRSQTPQRSRVDDGLFSWFRLRRWAPAAVLLLLVGLFSLQQLRDDPGLTGPEGQTPDAIVEVPAAEPLGDAPTTIEGDPRVASDAATDDDRSALGSATEARDELEKRTAQTEELARKETPEPESLGPARRAVAPNETPSSAAPMVRPEPSRGEEVAVVEETDEAFAPLRARSSALDEAARNEPLQVLSDANITGERKSEFRALSKDATPSVPAPVLTETAGRDAQKVAEPVDVLLASLVATPEQESVDEVVRAFRSWVDPGLTTRSDLDRGGSAGAMSRLQAAAPSGLAPAWADSVVTALAPRLERIGDPELRAWAERWISTQRNDVDERRE